MCERIHSMPIKSGGTMCGAVSASPSVTVCVETRSRDIQVIQP